MTLSIRYILLFLLISFQFKSNANPYQEPELAANVDVGYFALQQPQASFLPSNEVFLLPNDVWQKQKNHRIPIQAGKNWLIVEISNVSEHAENYVLVLERGENLLEQQFFIQSNEQTPQSQKSKRRYDNLIYSQVSVNAKEKVKLYIYLNAPDYQQVSVKLLTNPTFSEYIAKKSLTAGIAIGGLVAFTLFLFCVFIANQNRTIILLAAYFTFQTLLLMVMYGVNLHSVFPNNPELQGIEFPLLISLSAMTLLWFSSELFKLAYYQPKLHWVYQAVFWLLLANIGASLFLSLNINLLICHLVNIFTLVLLLVLCFHFAKREQKLTLFFTLVIVVHAIFLSVNILKFGWIEFDAQLFSLAYWINGLLIVFLLSRQSRLEIKEKHAAQREALESAMESRIANEELLALQAEDQEQLESRVQERTLELNIALQELEEANRELEQKNTLDDLTGLYNRRFYDQKLLAEFRRSRRNLTPLSMVLIDIDHFKQVNDTYGHSAGDICLVGLAKLIKTVLRRSSDVGCRYGGEEFCLILPETDVNGAVALAEEIRELVQQHSFAIESKSISLTISCGVSTYQQQADAKPVDIFDAADKALYRAKAQGRNQVINQDVLVVS